MQIAHLTFDKVSRRRLCGMLLAKKQSLLERMRTELEHADDPEGSPNDPMDAARQAAAQAVFSEVMAVESDEIGQIDHALQAIESGQYGICEHCGQRISPARLSVLPHASLCVACKTNDEAQARMEVECVRDKLECYVPTLDAKDGHVAEAEHYLRGRRVA